MSGIDLVVERFFAEFLRQCLEDNSIILMAREFADISVPQPRYLNRLYCYRIVCIHLFLGSQLKEIRSGDAGSSKL